MYTSPFFTPEWVQLQGLVEHGAVTRGDVAHVVAEVLESESSVGKTFDLLNGDVPVSDAVGKL